MKPALTSRRWTQWEDDMLKTLLAEGKPVSEMARILDRTEMSVYIRINLKTDIRRRRRFTQEEIEHLRRMCKAGASRKSILKAFSGRSEKGLQKLALRHGFRLPRVDGSERNASPRAIVLCSGDDSRVTPWDSSWVRDKKLRLRRKEAELESELQEAIRDGGNWRLIYTQLNNIRLHLQAQETVNHRTMLNDKFDGYDKRKKEEGDEGRHPCEDDLREDEV